MIHIFIYTIYDEYVIGMNNRGKWDKFSWKIETVTSSLLF